MYFIGGAIAGILAGNSAVMVFNRIPARWLCDYNEEPGEELVQNDTPRIKGYPYKMVFSIFFVLAAIKMSLYDWQYAVTALVSLWILLIIAIADKKYTIIPDQFVLLLAFTAIGYIPYHNNLHADCFGTNRNERIVPGNHLLYNC